MIPRDKLFHIGGGALSAAAVLVLLEVGWHFGAHWASLCGAVLVGFGYEWQQKVRKEGEVSALDALATVAGGAVVALIAWAA
jgi:hypothetical protein